MKGKLSGMRVEQRNNTLHTRRAADVAEGGTPGPVLC